MTGRIKKLIADKGFGFITPEGGGDDLFFHASSLPEGEFPNLNEGDSVRFALGDGPKGPRAEDVSVV